MIRPKLPNAWLRKYLRSGYPHSAPTISELAGPGSASTPTACSARSPTTIVPPSPVSMRNSACGHEPVSGLQYGDPTHRPNASLGPIQTAPFYAMALVPTPLGTSLGLRTDADARVLDATGTPIAGLYACGNDAASMSASEYPRRRLPGRWRPHLRLCRRPARRLALLHRPPPPMIRSPWRSREPLPAPVQSETLVVPIVGDPIAQVKSPDGITRAFAARNRNAVVVPLQIAPTDFDAMIAGLTLRQRWRHHRHRAAQVRARGALRDADRPGPVSWFGQCGPAQRRRDVARRPGRRRGIRRRDPGDRRGTERPAGPAESGPAAPAPRLRWPCWRRGPPNWRCTTPTWAAATA